MGFQVKPALENAVKDWRNDQLIQETRGDKKDKHEHSVGFFFLRNIVGSFMECQVFSRRLNQDRLTAIPFSITVIQVYEPAINYGEKTL